METTERSSLLGHGRLPTNTDDGDLLCQRSSSKQEEEEEDVVRSVVNEQIGTAAFLVRDAVLLEEQVENPALGAYDPYCTDNNAADTTTLRNRVSISCRRWCTYRPLLALLYATAWVLVLLTFVEPPQWCRSKIRTIISSQANVDSLTCYEIFTMRGIPAGGVDEHPHIIYDDNNDNDNNSQQQVLLYPNWQTLFLTLEQSHMIEGTCVAILSLFILLRLGRDGLSLPIYLRLSSSSHHNIQYSRIVQLVALLSIVLSLSLSFTTTTAPSSSLYYYYDNHHHPYARLAILLSLSSAAQRDLQVLWNMLPEVLNILAILAVLMLFYAWFGTVMFVHTHEGMEHFPNLIESLWTLWICVTTANYPDVMMSTFNQHPWSAVYFVSFMIISFFFFMNLILAAVFDEYQNAFQQRKLERERDSERDLRKAFALLDPQQTGGIRRESIMRLFSILNEDFPEFPTLSMEDKTLLFAILDRDGSSAVTEVEFLDFGKILRLEFVKTSAYATLVERYLPRVFVSNAYQTFCQAVKSSAFEYIIDVVLVLNAVLIGIQSYPELAGQAVDLDPKYWDGSIDTQWEKIEAIFTVIYGLETTMKLTVLGRRNYFESIKNVFDFVITTLAVASSLYVYYPNEYNDTRLIKMIVMARALRLLRLLTAMKRFQIIGTIIIEILPAASSIFMLLFCILYVFAVLGMHLYGGLITRDPSNNLAYLLLGTDFSDNDYWANNFNDMPSAMNVLFNLLVVNNWTECEAGFEATTQAKWVRLYFIAFHICAVILTTNLVIAFIMNAFFQELAVLREKTDTEIVGDGEAVIQNRAVLFDASEVTGTKTTLTGGYIARLRHTHSELGGDVHEQDTLRKFFTHSDSDASNRQ